MIAVAGFIVWTIQDRFFQEDLLSIQEASEKVESLYAGSVESFERIGESYEMTLERDGKVYDVVVDPTTGDISSLTFVAIIEEARVYKTAKEIRAIVAEQDKGEIQAINVREKANQVQYVVEVKQAKGAKTLIIDAETGKLLSEIDKASNVATSSESAKTGNPSVEGSGSAGASTTKPSSGNNSNAASSKPNTSTNSNNTATPSNNNAVSGNSKSSATVTKPAQSKPTNAIISQSRAIEIARSQLKGEVDSVVYEKTSYGGYYLVEIDGQQTEAVFQIHGVSGKVMSITRDDYQFENDDDDDTDEQDD